MEGLSSNDFSSSIQRAGIGGAIASSQVVEATKMFISGELGYDIEQLEPISVRNNVLVIRSAHPAYSQQLQQHQEELLEYVHRTFGITIVRVQFVI